MVGEEEEEEEGRFITMPPPRSNEQIQKILKLQNDLSSPSAPLSSPQLLPPSHKWIEVDVRERRRRGDERKNNQRPLSSSTLFNVP